MPLETCAYCGTAAWSREVGSARNLTSHRRIEMPEGGYSHARCIGHYIIDVGLRQVTGSGTHRNLTIARSRLGLPARDARLDFRTVKQVVRETGISVPEVSAWNQRALERLQRMSSTAASKAEDAAARRDALRRIDALLSEAGQLLRVFAG